VLITLGITGVTSYYKSGFFSPCRQTFLLRQIYNIRERANFGSSVFWLVHRHLVDGSVAPRPPG